MTPRLRARVARACAALLAAAAGGCASPPPEGPAERFGDEIVVAGRFVRIGTPVVLWSDPGGYDAHVPRRRFGKGEVLPSRPAEGCDTPARFGPRGLDGLEDDVVARVRARGFDADDLARRIDRFVIHYDACGTARRCFEVLHDVRGLSVHFLLDVDGTIYQTLDLVARARHARASNDRSVGVEIAHLGAYPDLAVLSRAYRRGVDGVVELRLPESERAHLRRRDLRLLPARDGVFRGTIRGVEHLQYDYTAEQYAALARLTAGLCRAFPRIRCDAPRDAEGRVLARTLTPEEDRAWGGIVGHLHVSDEKQDPGPAFDWEGVLAGARARLAAGP